MTNVDWQAHEEPSWSYDRVQLLRRLWADGLSCSQIANQLGGVTRNAVIGKVHRLKLSGRAKPVSSNPRPRRYSPARTRPFHPKPEPMPAPRKIEDIAVPISLGISIMDLTDSMCKWPEGDEVPFLFCGHKNFNGLPYCEYHARVAYQPADRRRVR